MDYCDIFISGLKAHSDGTHSRLSPSAFFVCSDKVSDILYVEKDSSVENNILKENNSDIASQAIVEQINK